MVRFVWSEPSVYAGAAEFVRPAPALTRMIHQLVGWDKETAIWWAGACELTFHFDGMLFWERSPFPPAH